MQTKVGYYFCTYFRIQNSIRRNSILSTLNHEDIFTTSHYELFSHFVQRSFKIFPMYCRLWLAVYDKNDLYLTLFLRSVSNATLWCDFEYCLLSLEQQICICSWCTSNSTFRKYTFVNYMEYTFTLLLVLYTYVLWRGFVIPLPNAKPMSHPVAILRLPFVAFGMKSCKNNAPISFAISVYMFLHSFIRPHETTGQLLNKLSWYWEYFVATSQLKGSVQKQGHSSCGRNLKFLFFNKSLCAFDEGRCNSVDQSHY